MKDPVSRDKTYLFVVNRLHSGGAEKQLLWMAQTLAKEKCQCIILELKYHEPHLRIDGLISDALKAGVAVEKAKSGVTYLNGWFRIRSLLQQKHQVVLWTWGYRADFLVLLQGNLLMGCKWFCSLRSANKDAINKGKWFIVLRNRWVTGYISNTWANCRMLGNVCPKALPKCRVVYNAIGGDVGGKLCLPSDLPRPLRVVMLGNVDRLKKGYDLAVQLAERIKDNELPVEIHIAGRLDSGEWLPNEIRRRNLEKYLFWDGEANAPLEYLRTGHIYLLMSRLEGTPNSLLEATNLGLPAIATNVGDLEMLAKDKVDLRLIPIGGVDEAYEALKEISRDWPEAVSMGIRGRDWCDRLFKEDVCRVKLIEVINQLLA